MVCQVGMSSWVVIPHWAPLMCAGVPLQVEHGIELFVANSADMGAGGRVDSFGVLLQKR